MALPQALDDENAVALAAIREEWQKLLRDTEARNRKKLDVLAKWVQMEGHAQFRTNHR